VHFAGRAPAVTVITTGIAAILAANGLVGEALLGKKLLVARGEKEVLAAVFSFYHLILVHLGSSLYIYCSLKSFGQTGNPISSTDYTPGSFPIGQSGHNPWS
jgi:hypothetical protein